MLLPRETWKTQIEEAAESEDEKKEIIKALADFFCKTPKATDERERESLRYFVKRYWTFDNYPEVDGIAETALKLIMNQPDALNKIGELRDFLKTYDECRFKYIEMSKAIDRTTDNK